MEEMRPIGSVVETSGSNSKIMIIGYYPKANGTEYHYLGVNWPFGYSIEKKFLAFNEPNIVNVLFSGFHTSSSEKFISSFPVVRKAVETLAEDKSKSNQVVLRNE